MAERGIAVSYESIRLWCIKFGPKYANRLRRRHQGYGDTFFIDEVFVNSAPKIVLLALDLHKDLINEKGITIALVPTP